VSRYFTNQIFPYKEYASPGGDDIWRPFLNKIGRVKTCLECDAPKGILSIRIIQS
jgi:hypothetical protein